MTRRFGSRATLAVEVGEQCADSPDLRIVDLWAGNRHLTVDDDVAFIPSFVGFLRSAAARVRHRDVAPCPFPGRSPNEIFQLLLDDETGFREQFWLLQWGETLDNVRKYAYSEAGELVIIFQFWRASHPFPEERGKVFVARIAADDFATTLEKAAQYLSADYLPRDDS